MLEAKARAPGGGGGGDGGRGGGGRRGGEAGREALWEEGSACVGKKGFLGWVRVEAGRDLQVWRKGQKVSESPLGWHSGGGKRGQLLQERDILETEGTRGDSVSSNFAEGETEDWRVTYFSSVGSVGLLCGKTYR